MNSLMENLAIIAPAFAAGLIVLLSHLPLGREVVRRGIIFIDLAIAQMAGLGIILASSLGLDADGWLLQAVALASAIGGALVISLLDRFVGDQQEAMIGICFVLASSTSLMLLANNPHGGEHLHDLLSGQILWVNWQQLWLPGLVSLGVLALYLGRPDMLRGRLFYLLFAVAITQSVQLVGVYLVFSSLVIPALATSRLADRPALFAGLLIGMAGYPGGLLVSLFSDLPAGAVIIWCLLGAALPGWLVIARRATAGG